MSKSLRTNQRGLVLALALCAPLVFNACTNPTSRAGQISYFTEGVITDVERITLDLDHYDTGKTAAAGAAVGAGVGQIISHDSKGTLIGAGIGAILGGASAMFADRTEGARLTIRTNQGLVLVDQPFSCYYRKGANVRMVQTGSDQVQVQVEYNGIFRTVEKGSSKDCPL